MRRPPSFVVYGTLVACTYVFSATRITKLQAILHLRVVPSVGVGSPKERLVFFIITSCT